MIDVSLRRVCIVMMSAVGDAVHVLPVINALKRHSPGVHITWILQPGPAFPRVSRSAPLSALSYLARL